MCGKEIEKIINIKQIESGERLFEVQWKNTWESEEHLRSIDALLIEDFFKSHAENIEEKGKNTAKDDNEEKDEVDEPEFEDLFSSTNSSKQRKCFKGGINAVISRLQKNRKDDITTSSTGKTEQIVHQEKNSQFGTESEEVSEKDDVLTKRTSNGENLTDTNQNSSTYIAKYPLSPLEAVEAKDGMLPSQVSVVPHHASMSHVSPRYVATDSMQRRASSSSLQSLKSNVDNITKLFVENADRRSSDGFFMDTSEQELQKLQPSVVLRCTICSEVFYDDTKFKQHMFMHDQVNLLKQDPPKLLKPGTFNCKFCHLLFDHKDKLKLHYSEEHEKEFVYTQPFDQLYQCTLCEKSFVDYSKLVHHHQTHQHSRREVFILPKRSTNDGPGGEKATTSSSTSSHTSNVSVEKTPGELMSLSLLTIKREDDNVFEDEQDNPGEPSMTTLDFQPVNDALLKTAAASETKRRYRCNLCDELFESESDRAKHSLIHVNRSSSLDCHICGKQFRHRTNLSTHLIVHSGVKPHQCHICSRRFTQKVNLQRHMHIHDGSRPFTCRMCCKSFTQKANLQRHILSHTEHTKEELLAALNEIPNESEVNNAINESLLEAMNTMSERKASGSTSEFRCDICDKTFAQKVNLQKHLMIHTGSRPFQCYVCGKAFRQKASLQKHYSVHTNGSTNFICQTCNRLFVSRTNLQRHMLVHAAPSSNQCYLCEQKFSTTDNLERHFSEHIEEATPNISLPQKYFEQSTPGQTFRCATCDIVFDSPIIFSQHLQCHQRGFTTDTTPSDLTDITKAYEENQACPLQCNACGVIFMSVAKLENHMATHAESSTGSLAKHTIGVMINTSPTTALVTSRYSTNASPKATTLSASSLGTADLSDANVEKKSECLDTKSPVTRTSRCPVCKGLFPSKAAMREHYSVAHLEPLRLSSQSSSTKESYDGLNNERMPKPLLSNEDVQEDDAMGEDTLSESEELLIKENEEFIKDNILGGAEEYESKGRYERGNYSCKICNRVLTYKYSLEKHMLLHTGSFPYKCTLCSKRFNHKANLDKHLVVHSGEKPYSCHICQRPFSQKSNLQRHQLTHTQNRDFICDVCGKRFNHMASLKTHSLIHTGAKPFSCSICSKRFNQKGNLKRHIQTHRTGKRNKVNGLEVKEEDIEDAERLIKEEEYYEEMCVNEEMKEEPESVDERTSVGESSPPARKSQRMRMKKNMDDYEFSEEDEPLPTMIGSADEFSHNTSNHTSSSLYEEDDAGEAILTVVPSDALESTMNAFDDEENDETKNDEKETFHCESCSKLFISMASLEAHKRTAHSLIVCDICGKQFSQKANLLKHKLIHLNKKPFQCRVCHKAFRQKANLQRHELIHNKDRKTVNCAHCNKSFRCTWSLKQHMKSHTTSAENPFGCSICGETFKEKEELLKHFDVHRNQIFTCIMCDENFYQKEDLLLHNMEVHDELPADVIKEIRENTTGVEKTKTKASTNLESLKPDVNEVVFPCRMCDQTFSEKVELLMHMETHDNIPKGMMQAIHDSPGEKISLDKNNNNNNSNNNNELIDESE